MLNEEPISKVRVNFNFKNNRTMRLNSNLKVLTDKTNMMILGIYKTKRNMVETFVLYDLYHCYMDKADSRIEGMKFNAPETFTIYNAKLYTIIYLSEAIENIIKVKKYICFNLTNVLKYSSFGLTQDIPCSQIIILSDDI
uniref:Uncharacterized protein n=1 Tax=Strongyloides venezuelensis TaxID=75913 RepID=A0A0K0G631_STRVS